MVNLSAVNLVKLARLMAASGSKQKSRTDVFNLVSSALKLGKIDGTLLEYNNKDEIEAWFIKI